MSRGEETGPLREIAAVRQRLNDLFEVALARWDFDAEAPLDAWAPAVDVDREPDRLVVRLEVAGVERSAIEVRVVGEEIVVDGQREIEHERAGRTFHRIERSYGRFARRVPLPPEAAADRIRAELRAGVLSIEVPLSGGGARRADPVPID